MSKAIGMVEYQTVSTGIQAADLMVKTALVDIIEAQTVCPGKYIVIIKGDLSAVKAAVEATKDSIIEIGAQNCHWAKNGAFTAEISADMLIEAGCEYVIIGHSERRQYFAETDETVNLKLKAALAAGLTPIVCVGETLACTVCGVDKNGVKEGEMEDEISRALLSALLGKVDFVQGTDGTVEKIAFEG